jgi:hypothetical protein
VWWMGVSARGSGSQACCCSAGEPEGEARQGTAGSRSDLTSALQAGIGAPVVLVLGLGERLTYVELALCCTLI